VARATGKEAYRGLVSSSIDQVVRDDGRGMLAAALEAKVAAVPDSDGRRIVVRHHGHTRRWLTTVAGTVPVKAPLANHRGGGWPT
jgi:hypothetical protein